MLETGKLNIDTEFKSFPSLSGVRPLKQPWFVVSSS